MPQPLRRVGLVVGSLLIVLFLSYQHDFTRDGGETREETKVGVWFSPWLIFSDVEKHEGQPLGGSEPPRSFSHSQSWSHHMELVSWSWPVLIAGLLLIRFGTKRKETTP